MLGLSLGGEGRQGIKIESTTVWIYKSSFIVTADKQITGINSKIKIDRKNADILQLGIVSIYLDAN
jgi:hypothetical protein